LPTSYPTNYFYFQSFLVQIYAGGKFKATQKYRCHKYFYQDHLKGSTMGYSKSEDSPLKELTDRLIYAAIKTLKEQNHWGSPITAMFFKNNSIEYAHPIIHDPGSLLFHTTIMAMGSAAHIKHADTITLVLPCKATRISGSQLKQGITPDDIPESAKTHILLFLSVSLPSGEKLLAQIAYTGGTDSNTPVEFVELESDESHRAYPVSVLALDKIIMAGYNAAKES